MADNRNQTECPGLQHLVNVTLHDIVSLTQRMLFDAMTYSEKPFDAMTDFEEAFDRINNFYSDLTTHGSNT